MYDPGTTPTCQPHRAPRVCGKHFDKLRQKGYGETKNTLNTGLVSFLKNSRGDPTGSKWGTPQAQETHAARPNAGRHEDDRPPPGHETDLGNGLRICLGADRQGNIEAEALGTRGRRPTTCTEALSRHMPTKGFKQAEGLRRVRSGIRAASPPCLYMPCLNAYYSLLLRSNILRNFYVISIWIRYYTKIL